jgi:hypothetical protein
MDQAKAEEMRMAQARSQEEVRKQAASQSFSQLQGTRLPVPKPTLPILRKPALPPLRPGTKPPGKGKGKAKGGAMCGGSKSSAKEIALLLELHGLQ